MYMFYPTTLKFEINPSNWSVQEVPLVKNGLINLKALYKNMQINADEDPSTCAYVDLDLHILHAR